MGQAVDVHRLHFAFTITFHYIFPQLTMGLALLLVYLKTKALRTGDGGRVLVFSRIEFPGAVSVRGEKTRTHGTLVVGVSRISRLVALRLFHRYDRCVDATPDGLPVWRQRGHRTLQLLGSPAEQVGAVAVCTHDAGSGANRLFCDGRCRRFLFTYEAR